MLSTAFPLPCDAGRMQVKQVAQLLEPIESSSRDGDEHSDQLVAVIRHQALADRTQSLRGHCNLYPRNPKRNAEHTDICNIYRLRFCGVDPFLPLGMERGMRTKQPCPYCRYNSKTGNRCSDEHQEAAMQFDKLRCEQTLVSRVA